MVASKSYDASASNDPHTGEGVSLFVTNVEFLKSIHDELGSLIEGEVAKGIMFRVGYRCGYSASGKLMQSDDKNYNLNTSLNRLWTNIGFCPLTVENISDDTVIISADELLSEVSLSDIESISPEFIRGYLAGLVSESLQIDFENVYVHDELKNPPVLANTNTEGKRVYIITTNIMVI